MNRFSQLIATIAVAITPIAASADAIGYIHPHYDYEGNLVAHDVFVEITARPEDSGLAGAFYIGARQGGKDIAVHGPNGWEAWQGGTYPPIAVVHPLNGNTLKFQILKGRTICSMATISGMIEVWAGYGALQTEREQAVQMRIQLNQISGRKGIDPDLMRAQYVQGDMLRNEKYRNVINYPCYFNQDG